jgi:hypothetical protein
LALRDSAQQQQFAIADRPVLEVLRQLETRLALYESAQEQRLAIADRPVTDLLQHVDTRMRQLGDRLAISDRKQEELLSICARPDPSATMALALREGIITGFQGIASAIQSLPAALALTWSEQLPLLIGRLGASTQLPAAQNTDSTDRLLQIQPPPVALPPQQPQILIQNNVDRRRVVLPNLLVVGSGDPGGPAALSICAPERSSRAIAHRRVPDIPHGQASDRSAAAAAISGQRRAVGEMSPGVKYRVALAAAQEGGEVQVVTGLFNDGRITDADGRTHDVATALWSEPLEPPGVSSAATKRSRLEKAPDP